jgi:heterodisulfide reductase subunit C
MVRIFGDLSYESSPRRIIEGVLADSIVPEDNWLWFCLTCNLCTDLCPMGVCLRDFIEAARRLLIEAGVTEHGSFCRDCGTYL